MGSGGLPRPGEKTRRSSRSSGGPPICAAAVVELPKSEASRRELASPRARSRCVVTVCEALKLICGLSASEGSLSLKASRLKVESVCCRELPLSIRSC